MKSVPTLCATGTVGAAATGLAFGESIGTSTSNLSTSPFLSYEAGSGRLDRTDQLGDNPRTPHSQETPVGHQPGQLNSDGQNVSAWEHFEPRQDKARHETAHGTEGFILSYADNTTGTTTQALPVLQRSRSSLQRLSSLNFSRSSSPLSSFRPASRSFTLSSFSTTPMLSTSPAPAPPTPNKLVKRSFSQVKPHSSDTFGTAARQTTLKRPATSYQRSATLSAQVGRYEANNARKLGQDNDQRLVDPDPSHLKHLFVPRVSTQRSSPKSRKLRPTTFHATVRRILPKDNSHPVLVRASVIDRAEVEFQSVRGSETDLLAARSRPATPASLDYFFKTFEARHSKDEPATNNRTHRPRRSQSIGNFLQRNSPSSRPHTGFGMVKDQLKRRVSRRVASGPAIHPSDADASIDTPAEREAPSEGRFLPSPVRPATADPDAVLTDTSRTHGGLTWSTTSQPTTPQYGVGKGHPSHVQSAGLRQRTPPSNMSTSSAGLANSVSRVSRASMTPSEITSSQLGSESDTRIFGSGDEDDVDRRSDTVYDSVRTGVTKSSAGYQGVKLETLFDKEPSSTASSHRKTSDTPAEENSSSDSDKRLVRAEQEGSSSISSPVKTVIADDSIGQSSATEAPLSSSANSSSTPKPLNLGRLEWDSNEDSAKLWSDDEDDPVALTARQLRYQPAQENTVSPKQPHVDAGGRAGLSPSEKPKKTKSVKINLFDWSEQHILDRPSSIDTTPPRPKTVHGLKKETENRSGRASSRGVPAMPHARSQSVPVTPEQINKNLTLLQKFGTWGIGTKGVAEDWGDDFEFNDRNGLTAKSVADKQGTVGDTVIEFVPKTIRDQQTSVLHNINLLKEWGLLIEELKDLRQRASSQDLNSSAYAGIFDEVDGMIDLADHEAQEELAPAVQHSITSSPGFESGDFDQSRSSVRTNSVATSSAVTVSESAEPASDTPDVTPTRRQNREDKFNKPITRPRQDSEAVARSVIEAVHNRHSATAVVDGSERLRRHDKLPFDTATLKHIVPYVSGLVRKVKRILREAEGLEESPNLAAQKVDETFRLAFEDIPKDAPATGLENLFEHETSIDSV